MVQTVTPSYKSLCGTEFKIVIQLTALKVKETQDHFKLQIIDPKVTSNASMPAASREIPRTPRRNLDFPSEHSKRSFLKLEPLEQRRLRAVETRPITTSTYLTESLDRHREMETSRLKDYLKAHENDANKPWNKPQWPGPKMKDPNDQSLRELAEIKKVRFLLLLNFLVFFKIWIILR
ncbi:unnamed protein product [Thelazia callipaeda]|uniref:TPX2_importin domain-containing protein n=1 Tax=Thelazia callipaeda TaxID=103827 RepID=A0A0N5CRR8_THECL|nr:unnamed protein product [Thelazia callipaeda]